MEAAEESQLTWSHGGGAKRAGRARTVLAVAVPLAAGLALRLWMLKHLFEATDDSLVYGGLAKNLLLHGRYLLNGAGGELYPTLIRLPGYPLFLAFCFRLFGMENYFSVACVQVGFDLVACLLLADFVRRVAPQEIRHSATLATLWVASLCPFTASYTPFPLPESLTICTLALAMWAVARFRQRPGWGNALCFTFAVAYATLLRPDGALAAVAFAPALLIGPGRGETSVTISSRKLMRMTVTCVLLALVPFGVWAARNWTVFHVFQPLAPRLAMDPDESTNPGWERWVKSWCLDFTSTYQIYWNVPWDKLDIGKLPSRAFDSPAQYAETAAIAADYNSNGQELTPEIDARFGRLADERIAAHPLRYYVWLPLGRLADMLLRPRVENLPIDLDWWVYRRHHKETEFSWAYVALNALYLLLGIAGLCLWPRFSALRTETRLWGSRFALALLAYMALRSMLLLTIEAPEARYTLEYFPMLFALGGIALGEAIKRNYLSKLKALPGRG